MADKKIVIPINATPMIRDMYDKLVTRLNELEKGSGKPTRYTRSTLFNSWVIDSYIEHCDSFRIELKTHYIYFLDEESRDEAQQLINDYIKNGMVLEGQLVDYISDKFHGFPVIRGKGENT